MSSPMGSVVSDSSTTDLVQVGPQSNLPITPQRRRYPASLNRISAPRTRKRSNSATYERLEDLLRDAGYKETRIFTPVAERRQAQAPERLTNDPSSKRDDGVGSVSSFLASLIPTRGRSFGYLWSGTGPTTQNQTLSGHRERKSEMLSVGQMSNRSSEDALSPGLRRSSRSMSTLPKTLSPRKRSTRSLGRTTLSPRSHNPPTLFRGDSRGRTASSLVTRTSVVCRSTSSSRASSRARGDRKREPPPSLGQTESMGDPWTQTFERHRDDIETGSSGPFLAGQSDDEGEEEVGLEAILIPPKRQQSIRSLRKHLNGRSSSKANDEGRWHWEQLGLEWTKKNTAVKKRQELPSWD